MKKQRPSLTSKQASKIAGVAPSTITRWAQGEKIRYVKPRQRQYEIITPSLEAYVGLCKGKAPYKSRYTRIILGEKIAESPEFAVVEVQTKLPQEIEILVPLQTEYAKRLYRHAKQRDKHDFDDKFIATVLSILWKIEREYHKKEDWDKKYRSQETSFLAEALQYQNLASLIETTKSSNSAVSKRAKAILDKLQEATKVTQGQIDVSTAQEVAKNLEVGESAQSGSTVLTRLSENETQLKAALDKDAILMATRATWLEFRENNKNNVSHGEMAPIPDLIEGLRLRQVAVPLQDFHNLLLEWEKQGFVKLATVEKPYEKAIHMGGLRYLYYVGFTPSGLRLYAPKHFKKEHQDIAKLDIERNFSEMGLLKEVDKLQESKEFQHFLQLKDKPDNPSHGAYQEAIKRFGTSVKEIRARHSIPENVIVVGEDEISNRPTYDIISAVYIDNGRPRQDRLSFDSKAEALQFAKENLKKLELVATLEAMHAFLDEMRQAVEKLTSPPEKKILGTVHGTREISFESLQKASEVKNLENAPLLVQSGPSHETKDAIIIPLASPAQGVVAIEIPKQKLKVWVEDYTERAIVVRGDTKPIKDNLGRAGLGGSFNAKLQGGPGWVFPKSQRDKVQNFVDIVASGETGSVPSVVREITPKEGYVPKQYPEKSGASQKFWQEIELRAHGFTKDAIYGAASDAGLFGKDQEPVEIKTGQVTALLKHDLKQAFPGVEFKISSHSRTVSVDWTNGPSANLVEKIAEYYKGQVFESYQGDGGNWHNIFAIGKHPKSGKLSVLHFDYGANIQYLRTYTQDFLKRFIAEKSGVIYLPDGYSIEIVPQNAKNPEHGYYTNVSPWEPSVMAKIRGLLSDYSDKDYLPKKTEVRSEDYKSVAAKLRKNADGMENQIEHKKHPRRGEYLERVQGIMYKLADMFESGNIPELLRGIRYQKDVDMLLSRAHSQEKWPEHKFTPDNEEKKTYYRLGLMDERKQKEAGQMILGMVGKPSKQVEQEKRIRELEAGTIGMKGMDFFPTPRPVVEKMLDYASITCNMDVLEPGAGKGDIAQVIKDRCKAEGVDIKLDVVELSGTLREILQLKGFNVVGWNFLDYSGKQYDRIIMNPPYSKNADIQHVRHAYGLLKPGGRLVAIISEHSFFAQDMESREFQEFIANKLVSEEQMEGAFKGKEAWIQTGVRTRIIVLDKPGN